MAARKHNQTAQRKRKRKASPLPKHLSTPAAKQYLGNPGNGTFWGWVNAGEFGPPIRLGERKLIWESDQLVDFVERRAREGYKAQYTPGMIGHAEKLDAERAEQASE
jgi:hypothetical protein